MFHAINHSLSLNICKDSEMAAAKGFVYHEGYTPLKIDQVVVVRDGTVEGNSTVDLILVDERGNKYVTMITTRLLHSIPA